MRTKSTEGSLAVTETLFIFAFCSLGRARISAVQKMNGGCLSSNTWKTLIDRAVVDRAGSAGDKRAMSRMGRAALTTKSLAGAAEPDCYAERLHGTYAFRANDRSCAR